MQKTVQNSKIYAFVGKLLAAFLVAMCIMSLCAPSALALSVEKCTARTNSETGNDVMGATETRITWEGQASPKERVQSVTLTFPEGSEFGVDDSRFTVLTGKDLMTRESPTTTFSSDGQSITASFAEPLSSGAYMRFEIYEVKFPAAGGEQSFAGSYVTADGVEHPIKKIPSVDVVGISMSEQLASSLSEMDWVKSWNSNKFLHLFLDPTLLVTSFPQVVKGFGLALLIVLISFPLAIPVGLILALMRMSRLRILRGIASIYVNVVRGTPVFLQIYIAFFGLPLAFGQLPEIPLGVAVLALNSAAYQCEIFRAGIQSISKGQFEASRSLGMNAAQTMIFVIIPQTVRRVIPTMTSEFILLYKDTSMLAAVGVMEIVMYAKSIVASTGSITPYIVAACFYLVITLPLAKVVGIVENALDMDKKDSPKSKKRKGSNVSDVPAEPEGSVAFPAQNADTAFSSAVASAGIPMNATVPQQEVRNDERGAR